MDMEALLQLEAMIMIRTSIFGTLKTGFKVGREALSKKFKPAHSLSNRDQKHNFES